MIKNSDDNTTIAASPPNTPPNTPQNTPQPVESNATATGSSGSMLLSAAGDVSEMKTLLPGLNQRIMNYDNQPDERAKLRTEIKEIFKTSPPGIAKLTGQLVKPSPPGIAKLTSQLKKPSPKLISV